MNYTTPLSKLSDKLRIKRNLMNHVNAVDATCIAANQRIEQLEHSIQDLIYEFGVRGMSIENMTGSSLRKTLETANELLKKGQGA